MYMYAYYVGISVNIDWHSTVLHTYMYIHECSTFVCTVLLRLSRTVHACIHTYVCTYLFLNVKIYVYTNENLYTFIYAIKSVLIKS